jgi:hypothetical protein
VKEISVELEEESAISEINILPDGRICIFGASQQVLEVLDAIPLDDPALRRRVEALRTTQARPAPSSSEALSARNDMTRKESSTTVTP